jgi:hypothetical protein
MLIAHARMENMVTAERTLQKYEVEIMFFFFERPETWVTVCTGHMGDTFSL